MDEKNICQCIQDRIDAAHVLLTSIGEIRPNDGIIDGGRICLTLDKISPSVKEEFSSKVQQWFRVSESLLKHLFGEQDQNVIDFIETGRSTLDGFDFKTEITRNIEKGIIVLETVIQIESLKQKMETLPVAESRNKKPKVFISHKSEDSAYSNALVNLINFIIGPGEDTIFCSSIPGYGVRLSGNILANVKKQFEDYQIFFVVIHSPRYYKSPICLNEMGAAWALGNEFCSFMTKDCSFDDMRGVIDNEYISIDINDSSVQIRSRLNEFQKALITFFGISTPDVNKWENARERFINEVRDLTYDQPEISSTDLFEKLYIPAFNEIFSLLDVDHYSNWAYDCAIEANSALRKDIFKNLSRIVSFIKTRTKHPQYANWDALLKNLGQLVADFRTVYSIYAKPFGDADFEEYYVERFYKSIPNNPNYERDLSAYNEHCLLISDLVFELTRLCNLILTKLREVIPDYFLKVGLLIISNRIDEPDIVYRPSEISDKPYPGLREFIKIRVNREKHFGKNPNIDAEGYEI